MMNSCLLSPRTFRQLLTCLTSLKLLLTSAMEVVISDTKERVREEESSAATVARNMVDVITVVKTITDVEAVIMAIKVTTVERKEGT